ncbi:hypothetical protein ACOME3_004991 [Neoechinorhynchus agilis]
MADNTLSSMNDLAESLGTSLIFTVFKIWLIACDKYFPPSEHWLTLKQLFKLWIIHDYVYCQWSQVCLTLTVDMYNVCWQMSEFTHHKRGAPHSINDPERLSKAWFLFLKLIDDPSGLIACGAFRCGTFDVVIKHICDMVDTLMVADNRPRCSIYMLLKLFKPWLFKACVQTISGNGQSMALNTFGKMVSSIQPDEYIDQTSLALVLAAFYRSCSTPAITPVQSMTTMVMNCSQILCTHLPIEFLWAVLVLSLNCANNLTTRRLWASLNESRKSGSGHDEAVVLKSICSFIRTSTGFVLRHLKNVSAKIFTLGGEVNRRLVLSDIGALICSVIQAENLELVSFHSLAASINLIVKSSVQFRHYRHRSSGRSFDFFAWTDRLVRILISKLNTHLADNYVSASLCFSVLNAFSFTHNHEYFMLIIEASCKFCVHQLEKESYRHVRDMHTAIVDAYDCCTRWLVDMNIGQFWRETKSPTNLRDEIVASLIHMVDMGLTGYQNEALKSTYSISSLTTASSMVSISSEGRGPASIRVKKAAELLLSFGLFEGHAMIDADDNLCLAFRDAFTFMCDPQHCISVINELTEVAVLCRTPFGCCEWTIKYTQKPKSDHHAVITPSSPSNIPCPTLLSFQLSKDLSNKTIDVRLISMDDITWRNGQRYISDVQLEFNTNDDFCSNQKPQRKTLKNDFDKRRIMRILLAQGNCFTVQGKFPLLKVRSRTNESPNHAMDNDRIYLFANQMDDSFLNALDYLDRTSKKTTADCLILNETRPLSNQKDNSRGSVEREIIPIPRVELLDERDPFCSVRLLFSSESAPETSSSQPLLCRPLVSVSWVDKDLKVTTSNRFAGLTIHQCTPIVVEIWHHNGILINLNCKEQDASKYWLSIGAIDGLLANEAALPKILSKLIADVYHKHRRSNPIGGSKGQGNFISKSGYQYRKFKLIEICQKFSEKPSHPLLIHRLCLDERL